jgi:hypothetical protein
MDTAPARRAVLCAPTLLSRAKPFRLRSNLRAGCIFCSYGMLAQPMMANRKN